jgi:hypothetical protein
MYTQYKEKPSFEELIKSIQQNKYSKYKYPLEYYKRLKEQVEAHETKGRSLQMRRNIIKAQQLANYQNEYDKIRSILEQSITKRGRGITQRTLNKKNKIIFQNLGANEEEFKKRKEHLEKLGARAIDGINDLR